MPIFIPHKVRHSCSSWTQLKIGRKCIDGTHWFCWCLLYYYKQCGTFTFFNIFTFCLFGITWNVDLLPFRNYVKCGMLYNPMGLRQVQGLTKKRKSPKSLSQQKFTRWLDRLGMRRTRKPRTISSVGIPGAVRSLTSNSMPHLLIPLRKRIRPYYFWNTKFMGYWIVQLSWRKLLENYKNKAPWAYIYGDF